MTTYWTGRGLFLKFHHTKVHTRCVLWLDSSRNLNLIQGCLESPHAVWSAGEKIKWFTFPAHTPFENREDTCQEGWCQLQIRIAANLDAYYTSVFSFLTAIIPLNCASG